MNKYKALIEELEYIVKNGRPSNPHNLRFGLCTLIASYTYQPVPAKYLLKGVCIGWSKYTGDRMYPVPSRKHHHVKAFEYGVSVLGNQWIGEYGKNRLELTALFLTALKKE